MVSSVTAFLEKSKRRSSYLRLNLSNRAGSLAKRSFMCTSFMVSKWASRAAQAGVSLTSGMMLGSECVRMRVPAEL